MREIEPDTELIDALSLKYTGNAGYQGHREGETRVTVRIEPLKVRERGLSAGR